MIAPQANAQFVAAMEQVLDIYSRPIDAKHPVVCMDETPRQLIRETRQPIAAAPGRPGALSAMTTSTNAAACATCSWPGSRGLVGA